MPRRLLMLNAALVAVAVVCALYVARQLLTPMPLPLPARASASGESTAATAATGGQPGEYSVVASRNLFSPTRSDTQTALTTDGGPAVPMVRPILHGVVLREDAPIAYLEDPSIKRVAGYRIGDSIVGGTVQTIAADHVVIRRPEGPVDVVGPVCETGDFLARDRMLPGPERGERLAILGSGAYGFVMASNYNTRPRPAEVVVDGGHWWMARPREAVEDLYRGERATP